MSTPDTGDAGLAAIAIASAKAAIAQAAGEEAEQLELNVNPSPEDIAEARELLGQQAGGLTVLRKAREIRKGRPPGSQNRRTDDFTRWILSFGAHPARALMEVASASPEILMENSKREVTRVLKNGDVVKYFETMSYEAARSLILRAAEALMPYIESKKPVAVDATIRGVMVVEEIGERRDPFRSAIEGEFVEVMRDLGEDAA